MDVVGEIEGTEVQCELVEDHSTLMTSATSVEVVVIMQGTVVAGDLVAVVDAAGLTQDPVLALMIVGHLAPGPDQDPNLQDLALTPGPRKPATGSKESFTTTALSRFSLLFHSTKVHIFKYFKFSTV